VFAARFGLATPRIATLAQPYSGELGQLGHEEQEWVDSSVEERQGRTQLQPDGPVPPDTWLSQVPVWYGSVTPPQSLQDAYLALYHDQGLTP